MTRDVERRPSFVDARFGFERIPVSVDSFRVERLGDDPNRQRPPGRRDGFKRAAVARLKTSRDEHGLELEPGGQTGDSRRQNAAVDAGWIQICRTGRVEE